MPSVKQLPVLQRGNYSEYWRKDTMMERVELMLKKVEVVAEPEIIRCAA